MIFRLITLMILVGAIISGCGLGTSKNFHEITLTPNDDNLKIKHNSYLVGIEKGYKSTIGKPLFGDCTIKDKCLKTNVKHYESPETRREIKKHLKPGWSPFGKTVFVSHITRFSKKNSAWETCFIYNIYKSINTPPGYACKDNYLNYDNSIGYYNRGWEALANLRKDVSNQIDKERVTHLLLYSTGWNTTQKESILNYNDLFRHLKKAASENEKKYFNPIFIGLSWPSLWDNIIGKIEADAFNKGNDADEIGAIWANIVINKVLIPLREEYETPIIVIGHSFGARILSQAINSRPLLYGDTSEEFNGPNLFIGLQPAFSVNRFIKGKGIEGAPFRDFSKFTKTVLMTSSKTDYANTIVTPITPFVGSSVGYKLTEEDRYKHKFSHITLKDNGEPKNKLKCESNKVTMIEASAVIKEKSGFSGSHNDIYNKEVGHFIWEAIKTCAPTSKKRLQDASM